MSCKQTKTGAIAFDDDCKCQKAVMTAYKSMLISGTPESTAMEAAKKVYAHHHPEDPKDIAALTVERWVHAGHFH